MSPFDKAHGFLSVMVMLCVFVFYYFFWKNFATARC